MKVAKKDNQHFALKVALRKEALLHADVPLVVCETHGGLGKLFQACYRHADTGLVCDKDPDRVASLARDRPRWRVYEGDANIVFTAGLGADIAWPVLDCDPYGEPWKVLEGFFLSARLFAQTMAVIVTDGGRQKQRIGGTSFGWQPWEARYGKNLWNIYLRCCQERFVEIIVQAGYDIVWWHGRYSRTGQQTYFAAVLRQRGDTCTDAASPVLDRHNS